MSTNKTAPKILRRCQSRSGKYWVELLAYDNGTYAFRSDDAGGCLGRVSLEAALARYELEKTFQPVSMVEVKPKAPKFEAYIASTITVSSASELEDIAELVGRAL